MEKIYLDHNATTPLHPEVKKTIQNALETYGNASSLHSFGRTSRELIENSRNTISSFINAQPSEIIFVGTGSEANNSVLSTVACCSSDCRSSCCKRGIITSAVEHPCVLETARCMDMKGLDVIFLKVDQYGQVSLDELKSQLKKTNTALVSVMMANNETGTIQNISEICRITHEHGALFHTDAVQAVGKIPVNVKELDVDFLSFSAHKIYGPKGIGALYVKNGVNFCPFIRGGHQEGGRRAGTENTLGILSFSKAVEMRKEEMLSEALRLKKLKNIFKEGLINSIPDIRFNGHQEECLPGTLNVSFSGAEGEAILLYLDLEGIAVSTGSACASGSLEPSHVLLASGCGLEWAHGSIRISLGRDTTENEIEYALSIFPVIIEKIRRMSTTYKRS